MEISDGEDEGQPEAYQPLPAVDETDALIEELTALKLSLVLAKIETCSMLTLHQKRHVYGIGCSRSLFLFSRIRQTMPRKHQEPNTNPPEPEQPEMSSAAIPAHPGQGHLLEKIGDVMCCGGDRTLRPQLTCIIKPAVEAS